MLPISCCSQVILLSMPIRRDWKTGRYTHGGRAAQVSGVKPMSLTAQDMQIDVDIRTEDNLPQVPQESAASGVSDPMDSPRVTRGGLIAIPKITSEELSDLSGRDLSGVNLRSKNFNNEDLRDMNFAGADLRDSHFENCDLSGVDFSGAKLSWTNFRNATLRGADFTGARIAGANFHGSDLHGVDLSVARRTEGADFTTRLERPSG